MTLEPGQSEVDDNARERIDSCTLHEVGKKGGLRTYQRRGQTSSRKRRNREYYNSARILDIEVTEFEVEESVVNSEQNEATHMLLSSVPKLRGIDLCRQSSTSRFLRHSKSNMGSKKTVAPKPKRSAGQYFLDLGQKDFSYSTCSVCGLFYARGQENDESIHKSFHRNLTQGIQFKGWQNERVVNRFDEKGNRVIVVLPEDVHHQHKVKEVIGVMEVELGLSPGWLSERSCKVYLFISSSKRIVGCLMAEPIKYAFRVVAPKQKQKIGGKCDREVSKEKEISAPIGSSKRIDCTESENLVAAQEYADGTVPLPQKPGRQILEELEAAVSIEDESVRQVPDSCSKVVPETSDGDFGSRCLTESHASDCSTFHQTLTTDGKAFPSPAKIIPGAHSKYETAKTKMRITDFYGLHSSAARVVKDTMLKTSNISPLIRTTRFVQTCQGKETGLVTNRFQRVRMAKISDFFSGTQITHLSTLQEHTNKETVGTVTIGSAGQQEGKKQVFLKEETVEVGDAKVGKDDKEALGGKIDILPCESQCKDMVRRILPSPKLESGESSGAWKRESDFSSIKQEAIGKAQLEQSAPTAALNCSDNSETVSREDAVQIKVEDTILPKGESDAAQSESCAKSCDDSSVDKSVRSSLLKQNSPGKNVMIFGNVKFSREVIPRKRSREDQTQELSDAVMYNKTPIPVVCGARVIWVSNAERRKGIASHLLDSMRKTFCLGVVLDPTQFAFSQPTADGRRFAARYCKTDEFLVYTTS